MKSLLGNNTRRADITFFKNGRIDISSMLAKHLRLKLGDVIDIIEDNKEYYLIIRLRYQNVIGRHIGQCYPTNKNKTCNNYRTYSKSLTTAILKITGGQNSSRLFIGTPVELPIYGIGIPLITYNPLNS